MAKHLRLYFTSGFTIRNLNFSTSSFVSNKWRLQQGLEFQPREFGPLTNLQDYSFVDGRPVPLSPTKKAKFDYQQKLYERIVQLNHEMDVGLEQYYQNQEQKKKEKEFIKKNKLKPKGAALLAKGNKNVVS